MLSDTEINKRLKQVCKNCIKANHRCIKEEAYIGLCAENDKDELIEIFEEKSK